MLMLDQNQLSMRWNETAALEIVGKEWRYAGQETSDDKFYVGFSADGNYAVVAVENYLFTITSDQNWS